MLPHDSHIPEWVAEIGDGCARLNFSLGSYSTVGSDRLPCIAVSGVLNSPSSSAFILQ